jgi:GNAT superfamily N-acetyltransferase
MALPLLSSDCVLAARLEIAEAANMLALAQALVLSQPDTAFEPIAGGIAVFAGVGSPMTHAMGIGMRGPVAHEELLRMEDFFRSRGSPCLVDLCPMVDPSVTDFFQSRLYRVIEFNNVIARSIQADEVFPPNPGVRPVKEGELPRWAHVIAQGFLEHLPVPEETAKMMAGSARESHCWFAGYEEPVGGAAMNVRGDIALLTGDAVIPAGRRQGWQLMLIRERLAAAQRFGCELAAASVLPGSGSHRNYERSGFQLIYMRINLASA